MWDAIPTPGTLYIPCRCFEMHGNLGENFTLTRFLLGACRPEGIYVGCRWYETADAQHNFWDGVKTHGMGRL